MILDQQLQFSAAQVVAASGPSTNTVDLGSPRNLSQGVGLAILITVLAAAAGGGTYQFDLQTDSTAAFGAPTAVFSIVVPAAQLAVGAKITLPFTNGINSFKQFARLYYTLGGTSPSVTLNAFLQPMSMIGDNAGTYYKSGYSVS